jgi:hypothetical protein
MAFTSIPFEKLLSDLVIYEGTDPNTGFTRKEINVTPPAGGAALELGTVVFRAKSADPTAAYAVVAAGADVALTNEYAIVFGDHYGFKGSFVPAAIAAGKFNAVSFIQGPMKFKEYYLKQIHSALTATQFAALKGVLEKQGLVVETTVA